jgi:hypothetical protein
MTKAIIAATALAVLALAPIAAATSAYAQWQPPTHRIPGNDPDPRRSSTYSCADELGYLRRVHASELAPVADWTQVWVTPICENGDSMFRTAGNAGKLRMAIAANSAMQKALKDKAFGPEDVVGIRMTGIDTLILYVHPFHK